MKIFLLFMIIPSIALTQNFFPTGVGDSYQIYIQYDQDIHGFPPSSGSYWENVLIEHDTIIEGKHFVNHPALGNRYYHYDESENKLMIRADSNVTKLAVDFNAANGDTFMSYIDIYLYSPKPLKSLGTSIVNFHGVNILYYCCKNLNSGMYNREFRFGDDVGLIYAYFHNNYVMGYSTSWLSVRSAIVDSTVYGEIDLEIDSLSPVQNRPVNLFPFSLTGYYTSNLNTGGYNGGEDMVSLTLDVIHMRGADTLGTYNYDFDSINVLIPLTPQEGDRIYLRSVASDTTIFNNVDVYPDEGYIEIIVLPPVVDVSDYTTPSVFYLQQNYPNPFNPSTNIIYSIPEYSKIVINVIDILGNEVAVLVNEEKPAGTYEVTWNAQNLSAGVYFCQLKSAGYVETKKMVLMK